MKKLFVIVLMLAYGLSSSGMTISLHYCCGKLDGFSLNGRHDKDCKMGGDLKNTDCCYDKQISASIKTDQQQAEVKWFQPFKQTIAAPVSDEVNAWIFEKVISPARMARGTPPDRSTIPLFIKNCVFRI